MGWIIPASPKVADQAGPLIADFVDTYFTGAASISFASHSLGARVVLSAVNNMSLPVRRVMLMAGAVDDNCLISEFEAAAAKVGQISLLSSAKDEVLSLAFPMGNLVSGIIAAGHPWWHAAIGHAGATTPWPSNLQSLYMIPDCWNYQHGNYLKVDLPTVVPPRLPIPTDVPPQGADFPADGAPGWSEAFSAAFVSSRFR